MEHTMDDIKKLQQEFSSCQKLLTAIGDEVRQYLICIMLEGECSGSRVIDIAMYDAPEESIARQIIENANPVISKIAGMIQEGKAFLDVQSNIVDCLNSSVINTVFYPLFVKSDKFTADDKCIGCGICVKQCPFNNVHLKENKPAWGKECTHCMACICKCPTTAIEYGKNSVGKVRYRCPM